MRISILLLSAWTTLAACTPFVDLDAIECGEEVCDGKDNDCDGEVDEGFRRGMQYPDHDGDTYGDRGVAGVEACEGDLGESFVFNNDDCNDGELGRDIHPGALEIVGDELDSDCDGIELCFVDADLDGFRSELTSESADIDCSHSGEAQDLTPMDCDDEHSAIKPGASEVCDGLDNDCDGRIDTEDDDMVVEETVCPQVGVCAGRTPICAGGAWSCGDPTVFEVEEVSCDGLDNDCDGETDEGLYLSVYVDVDGDGYGITGSRVEACPGPGLALSDGDCDDGEPAVHPEADEICDGLDNDCDGEVDGADLDMLPPEGGCDEDGVCADTLPSCLDTSGWICLHSTNPTYEDVEVSCDGLDNDCNGSVDGIVRSCGVLGVCANVTETCVAGLWRGCGDDWIAPSDDELGYCDGLDNDCDGAVDEGCPCTAADSPRACGTDVGACEPGEQQCVNSIWGACDGGQLPVVEFCDGANEDNDCNGQNDDEQGIFPIWSDNDRDGYGSGEPITAGGCELQEGQASNGDDCDDTASNRYPGADEICDGVDNNCNTVIDDNPVDTPTDLCRSEGVCEGTVAVCRDGGWTCPYPVSLYEDPERLCDGIDNDCDGTIDEGLTTEGYLDGDGDGFGGGEQGAFCSSSVVVVADGGDCNDDDNSVNPDATETVGDGIDQNCDGHETCFVDADQDGYRTDQTGESEDLSCEGELAKASADLDCNGGDGDPTVYPGAPELCDEVDNDCDEVVDEDVVNHTFYLDNDTDGYGDPAATIVDCKLPGGYVAQAGDCDDNEYDVHEGATEVIGDEVDEDCDGGEICWTDTDDDTYRSDVRTVVSPDATCQAAGEAAGDRPGGDCDDDDDQVHPGAGEIIDDTIDQDCDGHELCLVDGDSDSYRPNEGTTMLSDDLDCDDPGEAHLGTPGGDCNDSNPTVNPGIIEQCDSDELDNDCDGEVDECNAVSLPDIDLVIHGVGSGDRVGRAVALVPNVIDNASGTTLLVGSRHRPNAGSQNTSGAVYGFSASTMSSRDAVVAVTEADVTLVGGPPDAGFGAAIAWAGHFASTPTQWVAVGVPEDGSNSKSQVIFMSGPFTDEFQFDDVGNITLVATDANEHAGAALAFAGDANADGHDDVLVGAPGARRVYLVEGSASVDRDNGTLNASPVIFSGNIPGTGAALAAGRDINGDGSLDTVVGAPGSWGVAGAAYVVLEPYAHLVEYTEASGAYPLDDRAITLSRGPSQDTGASVVICNLAGGPNPGVAVGSPGAFNATGVVDIVFEPTASGSLTTVADVEISGLTANDQLGSSLACADVNGDSQEDLILGAPGVSMGSGAVYVVFGPLTAGQIINLLNADLIFAGLGGATGRAVTSGLDFLGSTTDDIVLTAPLRPSGAALQAGAAFVYSLPSQ